MRQFPSRDQGRRNLAIGFVGEGVPNSSNIYRVGKFCSVSVVLVDVALLVEGEVSLLGRQLGIHPRTISLTANRGYSWMTPGGNDVAKTSYAKTTILTNTIRFSYLSVYIAIFYVSNSIGKGNPITDYGRRVMKKRRGTN